MTPFAYRAALVVVAGLVAHPAAAVEDYESCVALVSAEPELALIEAERWERFGGGAAAGHCRALALSALGAGLQAAEALLDTVETYPELTAEAQADLIAQAARIHLDAGLLDSTSYLLGKVSQLDPDLPDLFRLRARLRLEQDEPADAAADLDTLLNRPGARAEDVLLRAVARRRLGDAPGARADALWALELEPGNAAALLELGIAEEALGNRNAARNAWLDAIAGDPEGAQGIIGRAAQLRLQKMETGAE